MIGVLMCIKADVNLWDWMRHNFIRMRYEQDVMAYGETARTAIKHLAANFISTRFFFRFDWASRGMSFENFSWKIFYSPSSSLIPFETKLQIAFFK